MFRILQTLVFGEIANKVKSQMKTNDYFPFDFQIYRVLDIDEKIRKANARAKELKETKLQMLKSKNQGRMESISKRIQDLHDIDAR